MIADLSRSADDGSGVTYNCDLVATRVQLGTGAMEVPPLKELVHFRGPLLQAERACWMIKR